MRRSYAPLFSLAIGLLSVAVTAAQTLSQTSLQVGTPVERTLGGNQSHNYNVALEQNQFMQLVVEQHGIDVIVRVFSPSGRRLGEFDSPNGDDGPENVTVIAADAGQYRIEVTPLGQIFNPSPGKYEIKITEIRKATEEELRAANQQDQLKPKAQALVTQAVDLFPQVRRPETRAGFQIKAAQILWESDQKRALKLFEQTTESIKEIMVTVTDTSDSEYYQNYELVQQLRRELVTALTPIDPEKALDALRSTSGMTPPAGNNINQRRNEQQLELQLIGQLAKNDPRRSFQMAEESLKAGASDALIGVLYQLAAKDSELAARLAHDIAAKVENEKFWQNPQAGFLAISLLNLAHQSMRNAAGATNGAPMSFLTPDDTRDLFQKMVAEALAYQPPTTNRWDDQRNLAQNLINTLKRMTPDLQAFAPDKKAALDEKLLAVQMTGNPQQEAWAKYQSSVGQGTPEAALESIAAAPEEIRASLYEQVSNRFVQNGDIDKARLIVTEKISNPSQRQAAMRNLDRQAILTSVSKGRIDETLRILTNFRPLNDRVQIIGEIVTRIGPGLKRAAAMNYLEQLGAMLDTGKASSQQHMFARLQLVRAFSRYDVGRAFDLLDPLLEQFNELAAAAVVMNGFNERFYRDGELITNNGNTIANMANQMSTSLAGLALMDFDKAKGAADRLGPLEIRLAAYLMVGQQATRDMRGGVVDF